MGQPGEQLHQRGEHRCAFQPGGLCPCPGGGGKGAGDRSELRAGTYQDRFDRDGLRQRSRWRSATLSAGVGSRSDRVIVLGNDASFLQSLGRLDEALALEEAVFRRDPVNATTLDNLGIYQRLAGRYDAAITSFRTLLSLSPNRGGAHDQLGIALMQKGDAPAALAEIEQEKSEVWRMIGLPMAYCALGRKADYEKAIADEIK